MAQQGLLVCNGSDSRGVHSNSVLVTSRASAADTRSMSTQAACLLVSKFAPAIARLFVEFRRLRDGLPPARAREYAKHAKDLRDAHLMHGVRPCVCH